MQVLSIADHEANLRVAAAVQARTSGIAIAQPRRRSRKWPLLALGALLSISLGLIISAALIQVPSYSSGRVVVRMPVTNVVATTGGRVVDRLVVANLRVHAGEAIVRFDATDKLQAFAQADPGHRSTFGAYPSKPE